MLANAVFYAWLTMRFRCCEDWDTGRQMKLFEPDFT